MRHRGRKCLIPWSEAVARPLAGADGGTAPAEEGGVSPAGASSSARGASSSASSLRAASDASSGGRAAGRDGRADVRGEASSGRRAEGSALPSGPVGAAVSDRPGRGRPSPAWRPASEGDAEGTARPCSARGGGCPCAPPRTPRGRGGREEQQ
ncbi:hypothetical protein ACFQ60_26030 [Streptomyces zhihengii]